MRITAPIIRIISHNKDYSILGSIFLAGPKNLRFGYLDPSRRGLGFRRGRYLVVAGDSIGVGIPAYPWKILWN